jgi:dienelactone hydrolase
MTRVGGSSPVTAAGPCRTHTGFPILPAGGGAPRNSSCHRAHYRPPQRNTATPSHDPLNVRDYRHAVTYASTLAEVDADRIGIWGSSYSGGAARDWFLEHLTG